MANGLGIYTYSNGDEYVGNLKKQKCMEMERLCMLMEINMWENLKKIKNMVRGHSP